MIWYDMILYYILYYIILYYIILYYIKLYYILLVDPLPGVETKDLLVNWFLVCWFTSYWLSGYWLLVSCYWFPVTGYWLRHLWIGTARNTLIDFGHFVCILIRTRILTNPTVSCSIPADIYRKVSILWYKYLRTLIRTRILTNPTVSQSVQLFNSRRHPSKSYDPMVIGCHLIGCLRRRPQVKMHRFWLPEAPSAGKNA